MLSFVRPMIATEITTQKLLSQEFAAFAEEDMSPSPSLEASAANIIQPAASAKKSMICETSFACKVTEAIRGSKTSASSDKNATPLGKLKLDILLNFLFVLQYSHIAHIDSALPGRNVGCGKTLLTTENLFSGFSQSSSSLQTSDDNPDVHLSLQSGDKEAEEAHLLPAPIIDFIHDSDDIEMDICKFCI